jgi:hypothetical protein
MLSLLVIGRRFCDDRSAAPAALESHTGRSGEGRFANGLIEF